ncbi:MAG: hypothetical protein A2067_01005 [Deltaproteobacteria bacterium GWB2_42_7]|nr:MAG: hypothetical protein A2067_01005 [Deltaproteobacteria bacterium GWB2_42_7]
MKIVDLKKEVVFIEQYIELRNSYAELLLTSPVGMTGTREWLKRDDIEIRGLADGCVLLGVVILYISRNNEVALFAKERNQGIGSQLLKVIESVAMAKKLEFVRAWVLEGNIAARRTFEKNGFIEAGTSRREYMSFIQQGIDYKKNLKGSR